MMNIPKVVNFLLIALLLQLTFGNKANGQFRLNTGVGSPSGTNSGLSMRDGSGTLVYSFPLLNLQADGVSLPISLVYSGEGVRVNSRSSYVGQNWSLSFGGKIVRNQHGMPDDLYIENTDSFNPNGIEGYLNGEENYFNMDEYEEFLNVTADFAHQGVFDLNPDVFTLETAFGLSDQFSIKRKTSKVPANASDIDDYDYVSFRRGISGLTFSTSSNRQINTFKVTDRNGNLYVFGDDNGSGAVQTVKIPEFNDLNNVSFNNEWLVSRILNSSGSVLFNFQYGYHEYAEQQEESYWVWATRSTNHVGDAMGSSGLSNPTINRLYRNREIYKIVYEGGEVEFVPGAARLDEDNLYELGKIIQRDRNGEVLKRFEFNYEYLGSTDNYRMYLSSIDEYNNENTLINTTSFDYYDGEVPRFPSPSIDLWGFHNGKNVNVNLETHFTSGLFVRPEFESNMHVSKETIRSFLWEFSDRAPSVDHTRPGVLKKISDSQDRTVEFEYELNQYSRVNNNGVLVDVQTNGSLLEEAIYPDTYTNELTEVEFYEDNIVIPEIITHSQWVQVKFTPGDPIGMNNYPCIEDMVVDDYLGPNRQSRSLQFDPLTGELDYDQWSWIYVEAGENLNFVISPNEYNTINPGVCPVVDDAVNKPHITIRYYDENTEPGGNVKNAGGLRIKKIITDSKSENRSAKIFSYNAFDDETSSSGILLTHPMQINKTGRILEGGNSDYMYSLIASSNLSSKQVSDNVVYENIESKTCPCDEYNICIENVVSENVSEVTRNYYQITLENDVLATNYPFVPTMVNSSRQILLDKTEFLDWDENVLRTDDFSYETFTEFAGDQLIDGIQTTLFEYNVGTGGQLSPWNYKNFDYQLSPEVTRLTKTDHYILSDDRSLTASVEVEYYDDDFFDLVTNKVELLEDGTKVVYLNSYSGTFDFDQVTAQGQYAIALEALQEKGNMREPVESLKILVSTEGSSYHILEHKILLYKLGTDGSVYLDKEVSMHHEELSTVLPELKALSTSGEFVFELDEAHNIIEYNEYSEENLLLEWKDSYKKYHSIIYDEDSKTISAEVKGSQLSKSRYTSFEIDGFYGGWNDISETHIIESNEDLRAFSGSYYYALGTIDQVSGTFNSIGSEGYLPEGQYLLSFVKNGYVQTFYGGSVTEVSTKTKEIGQWTLVEKVLQIDDDENNYITLSSSGTEAFVDEVRLHDLDGVMNTAGYLVDGLVQYKSDANYNVIRIEYDQKGRPIWKFDSEDYVIEYNEYVERDIVDGILFNKQVVVTPKRRGVEKDDIIDGSIGNSDITKSIIYSDGQGRVVQKLTLNTNPSSGEKDKVEFVVYDEYGRELRKYLPYYTNLSGDDSYRPNAEAEQLAYYQNLDDPQERTNSPWVETKVEASPLQRVIEQGGIGDELQPGMGNSITLEYGWNEATDEIYHWQYVENGGPKKAVLVNTELMWPAGTLRKVTTTDPDGKVTKVFTDMRGREVARCILAKTHLVSGKHETGTIGHTGVGSQATLVSYTVYDDFDRPRFEISPFAMEEVSDQLTPGLDFELNSANRTNLFKNRIVYYEYDEKGRLSYRSLPIDKEVNYVFDVYDRVIMSQDSEQSLDDKWSFIKYDSRGRTVMTGEIESTLDRDAHQAAADLVTQPYEVRTSSSGPSGFNYTNDAYPSITASDVYAAYFFDNYNFTRNSSSDFVPFGDITTCSEITRGLATGSRVRVFEGDGTSSQTLLTVLYYDDDAQIIQTFSDNHKGGFDRVDNYINDFGQIDQSIQHHKYENASDTHTFKTRYVYFPESRKVQNTYCQLDDDPEVMVSNRYYDEKGQLKDLKYHRKFANYLQRIDYRYNAQGRLTHINNTALIDDGEFNHDDDDIFGQELTYFTPSPEYNDPGSVQYGDPLAEYNFVPQYGGNISSMMWNAKTPEQDGTTLSRYAYVYRYDDLGQLTEARFAADDPSMPGEFTERLGEFDEMVNYDLGGNILKINRNHSYYGAPLGLPIVDELTYTYTDGYKLESVSDNAVGGFQPDFKHFVNGVNQAVEYTYDAGNRLIEDWNKKVRFAYNAIGLPMQVEHTASDYYVRYMYDAAGNKLQKYQYLPPCPPGVLCSNEDPYDTDYIGNFVYEKGELKMVYHPEGVIRPTPSQASNETDYVYDYFVKDYLGNVRAVITEEDAEIVDKFLATMEDVHAGIEEANFDNINETREDLPTGYPIDASVPFNQKIAELSAANGTEIGPSLVLPVRKGEKVSLSTRYFYEEDAPGTTYDNVGFFVDEILIALASSGVNVLQLTEAQLLNIAAGDPAMAQSITSLLNSNFDNSDIYKPHAYLVWMLYDNQMKLIPQGSGAQKVVNPNELETLIESNITATADGYMHVYVSNGSEAKVNFDNFLVQHQKGKVRQINDYYPYGLTISGLHGDHDDYLDKYTGKELQTGEFDPSLSSGLEMFDFGSRFYDPQLGRWFAPDPAEQFINPYLGIANNPVVHIDPNGELAIGAAMLIGAAVAGYIYTAQVATQLGGLDNWEVSQFVASVGRGAVSAGVSFGLGETFGAIGNFSKSTYVTDLSKEGARALAHGLTQGMITEAYGGVFHNGFYSAFTGSVTSSAFHVMVGESALGSILVSGVTGGVITQLSGGDFMDGFATAVYVGAFNHAIHNIAEQIELNPGGPDKKNLIPFDEDNGIYQDPETKILYAFDDSGVLQYRHDPSTGVRTYSDGSIEIYPTFAGIAPDYTLETALFSALKLPSLVLSVIESAGGAVQQYWVHSSGNGSAVTGIDKFIIYVRRTNSRTNAGSTYNKSIKYWNPKGGKRGEGGWEHFMDW